MGGAQEPIDYRSLFRCVPTPLVVLDPQLLIVDANDAYQAATMRSRPELVGHPILEAFPENPRDPSAPGAANLGASLRRVLRDRVTDVMALHKYDIPQVGGGFEARWWAPVSVPVLNSRGEVTHIVHRAEDVTAYVQAQQEKDLSRPQTGEPQAPARHREAEPFAHQALWEQRQTLQDLADSLDTVVIGCDVEGRPVVYNEAARALVAGRIAGASADQWPSRLHLYTSDGSPLSAADHPLAQALRGEHVRDAMVVMRSPGTPVRVFRMHARPVGHRSGLAAVVAMHDVTAVRRTARLKECELEIAKLTAGPAPTDGVLAQVVRLIGVMTGWIATEFWIVDDVAHVLRRSTCWAGDDRYACEPLPEPLPAGEGAPGRAWQTNEAIWVPDVHRGPDPFDGAGPGRAALAIPVPSGSDVLGVLVCYSDTTEVADDTRTAILTGIGAQLGGFLERRRAESLAAELDRTKDEYIALVGHELRTPLTSIQAYTEILVEDPELSEEHREMLAVMHRNVADLHAIVVTLLDVAGLRSGHLELDRHPMNLTDVVRAATDDARARADGRVTIDVNTTDAAPVHGDARRLRQVVDELVSNALTWAPDASTVGVNLHADSHAAVLSVSNTGKRIPDEERARLFELFFRGRAARHQGVPGKGLGLTLVRAIVELHGGTTSINDPDEAATVFTVRLPTRR
ncbi:ATP-binding protein [Actinoplanes sp. CA-030573]|uniref:PAS domain-containing sensor histidine kinase n=1 Tax=Actinoplanes sp. CA-030573 TaxID=3239898 RepID=UPI003D945C83